MEVAYIPVAAGISIIQSRIIELTNKRVTINSDIEHYESRLELGADSNNIDLFRSRLKRLKSRLAETEKMLLTNQQLLGYDDSHEYQLEN